MPPTREANPRAQAAEVRFVEQHAGPMPFGDGPDNRQSQAAARFVGLGAAIEAVEDALPVFGRNARAGVVDFDEIRRERSSPTATSTLPPAGV
jgi:hypothetical protein